MTVVNGGEPAVATAGKQQRLVAIVGVGLDRAEENHVVAAIISIGRAALETRDAIGNNRRLSKAWPPFDASKFVVRRFRKFVGERLLRRTQHIDCEMAGVLKHAQA